MIWLHNSLECTQSTSSLHTRPFPLSLKQTIESDNKGSYVCLGETFLREPGTWGLQKTNIHFEGLKKIKQKV